jgi:molybdate/tungstate transport system substrate-binding protein
VNLMERDLGPSFSRAEGYSFAGIGAGSTELVAQIKGHVHRGDVFVSASAKADRALEGATNGAYVDWYVSFARAPLVIGYSKTSRFADAFRSQPWWQVISDPAIRVGRTDPALDPKGKLTAEAITAASAQLRLPSLTRALGRFEVFPEESLVGRLESGQLDAGFFYSSEAAEQHIPAVGLAPVSASATYTATILAGAGDRPGAEAFLAYLLGPTGSATLRSHGLTVIAPVLSGSRSALPASLRPLVP